MGVEFVVGQQVWDPQHKQFGVIISINKCHDFPIKVRLEVYGMQSHTLDGYCWLRYREDHPEWQLRPLGQLQLKYALTL